MEMFLDSLTSDFIFISSNLYESLATKMRLILNYIWYLLEIYRHFRTEVDAQLGKAW